MIQKTLFKILMSPFALLYGMGVALRNGLYTIGLLKEISFNIPVISIGNLTMGGAGKTPHVEYLANWLQEYINIAVLSRGYKRKTKGFRTVGVNDTADTVGDEPGMEGECLELPKSWIPDNVQGGVSETWGLLDDHFVDMLVRDIPGLNDVESAYRTSQACFAALESARTGQTVRLD